MHSLWLAFAGIVALVAVLPPFIAPDPGTSVPAVLPAGLALATGLGALAGTVAIDRSLAATPPADDTDAVVELRSRLVMQAALAEAPALLGVVLTFVFGPPWVVVTGAAPGLIAMLIVRPRRARLERFDARWRSLGADVSLVRAMDLAA